MNNDFLILIVCTAILVIFIAFWKRIENDDFFRMKILFREDYKYYKYCLKNKDNFQVEERRITSYVLIYDKIRIIVWDDGLLGIIKNNDCVFTSFHKKAAEKLKEALKPKIEEYEKENKNKRNKSYNLNS